MVAKAGLGLIGLGAIGIGGVVFAKPEWLGINKEVTWTPLSADHDFSAKASSDYTSTNFGGKYKNYLVGVVGTDNVEGRPNTNKAMWEKLFKRWTEDSPGNKESLKKGFKDEIKGGAKDGADESGKYLNNVCQEVYKSATSEVTSEGAEDKYKESSVWKYCSPGLLTHTDKDGSLYSDKEIGGDSSNKTKLVSVTDSSNDWFWEQRNKDFWEDSGNWSGSGATSDDNKSVFKEAFSKKNETANNISARKTVKELCGKAYKLDKSSKTTDNTDAQKFCQLETNN